MLTNKKAGVVQFAGKTGRE